MEKAPGLKVPSLGHILTQESPVDVQLRAEVSGKSLFDYRESKKAQKKQEMKDPSSRTDRCVCVYRSISNQENYK